MESISDYIVVSVIIILILSIMIYLLGIVEQLFRLVKLRTSYTKENKSTVRHDVEDKEDMVKDTDSLDANKYS